MFEIWKKIYKRGNGWMLKIFVFSLCWVDFNFFYDELLSSSFFIIHSFTHFPMNCDKKIISQKTNLTFKKNVKNGWSESTLLLIISKKMKIFSSFFWSWLKAFLETLKSFIMKDMLPLGQKNWWNIFHSSSHFIFLIRSSNIWILILTLFIYFSSLFIPTPHQPNQQRRQILLRFFLSFDVTRMFVISYLSS